MDLGITVLSEGTRPMIDIVAVHGLGGDPRRTWTHKNGSLWLKDYLPEDFPNARIMTFGYDSRIRGSTLNGFKESAQLLLTHLEISRHGLPTSNRPIIFICHSLGGIVVKEALVRASRKELHADIGKSTIGIIFMGTPHRGSPVATLGSIVANVAKSLLLDISTSHLEDLVPGSPELQKLTADFCTVILEPQIEIVSFFEDSKLKLGISSILVVPQASAVLEPEGTYHQAISLHGNHRQMCQFPAKDDSQYRLVKGTLSRIIAKKVVFPTKDNLDVILEDHLPISNQQLLSWLDFQVPIEEVPFEQTCNWIRQKPLFCQWHESPGSALLWVRGAPGIGKTVLASYITTLSRGQSGTAILHASCNTNMSNSLHSIVRGMIGQLLRESLSMPEAVNAIFQLQVQYPNVADIPFNEMLAVLPTMMASFSGTTVILDGLDELEDGTPELEQLLDFIINRSQQTAVSVKILLLSRDVSFLQHYLASQPSFIIEPEDTIPGILRFVRAKIKFLKHLAPYSEMIQGIVEERSKGLFLWVEYFLSGLEGLRNTNEIYEYLENTKDGLTSTYTDILQRLETGRSSLTRLRRKILTITAASFRALTLLELGEVLAVREGIYKIDDGDRVLGGWDTIHEACGPLLQYTNDKIDLLHLSAREFILSPTERIRFESLPRDNEEAHQYMAVTCITYLSFVELRPSFTGDPILDKERQLKYPLLEYATLHWADHIIKSGNLSELSINLLQRFITSLSGITWAVSYFPYFKFRDGESLFSAFGLLQTQISLVKIVVRKSLTRSSTHQRTTLLKCLDVFLIQSFQNAVSLETDEGGPNHRDTMERQLDLSKVYQASRDLDQAYTTATKIYTLSTEVFGAADSLALRSKHQQLQVAMELESLKENPSFYQISLSFQALSAALEKTLGPYHKDTLRCNHDIGLVLTYEGKTEEGLKVLKVVLGQMRERLGRHALLTQRSANNVANALYTLGEFDEAEAVLSSIPEVRKVSRPNPTVEIEACHPYTFDSLEILAITLCCKRDFERSITMHERAMKGRAALFGQDDPSLFEFALNLGLVFERQRQYEKAAEHYRSWLYVARKHGMELQIKQIQKVLDKCLKTWTEEVERGALFRENIDENTLRKYTRWCRLSLREAVVLILALPFILSVWYFLAKRCCY